MTIMTRLTSGIARLAFAAALVAGLGTAAQAQSEDTACTSDADCDPGGICQMAPCAAPPCDPDDPNCNEEPCVPSGYCDYGGDPELPGLASCEQDEDCPDGTECEVVGGSSCACPDNGEPCDCGDPVEFKACVPKACTTAADCGDDQVCLSVSYETCTASSSAPCREGEACDPPPEPVCETTEESFCAPKYVAPCDTASDCGDGFTCEDAEVCECTSQGSSGSGSIPPNETDPDPDPAPDSDGKEDGHEPDGCTCTPTGLKYCKPTETICTTAADCPAEWTCETMAPDPVPCTTRPGEAPDCPEPPPGESMCAPPGWSNWAAGESGYDEATDLAAGGDGTTIEELTPEQRGAFAEAQDPADACAAARTSGLLWLAWALLLMLMLRRRGSRDRPATLA